MWDILSAREQGLDAYRRRRVFAKNRDFPGRLVPHFVDAAGTRCAMGHLIEASGGRDLVQYVARERNYARVRELRSVPELGAWLDANGISLDEAAQIQPSYCATVAANCLCREVGERDYCRVRRRMRARIWPSLPFTATAQRRR